MIVFLRNLHWKETVAENKLMAHFLWPEIVWRQLLYFNPSLFFFFFLLQWPGPVSIPWGETQGISFNWMITELRFGHSLLNSVLNIYNIKEVGKNNLSKQTFWNHHALLLWVMHDTHELRLKREIKQNLAFTVGEKLMNALIIIANNYTQIILHQEIKMWTRLGQ